MYEYRAKALDVLDGDTVRFEIDLGLNVKKVETCRLVGINTPELSSSDLAQRAAAFKAKLRVTSLLVGVAGVPPAAIEIKVKTLKPYPLDKYGRWLATVLYRTSFDGPDTWWTLNEVLVTEGLAAPYDGGKRS